MDVSLENAAPLPIESRQQAFTNELNGVLSRTAFLGAYRFTVQSSGPGRCELLIPFDQQSERPGGVVSGMIVMGAADVAMWLAIMTLRGTNEHWVTADMKTAFLRGAVQEDIVCEAVVLKLSPRSAYGTVSCHGQDASLVAHHVISYVRSSQPATKGPAS